MRAEVVSVGTEILLGQITDTNAVELGKAFAQCGIDHTHRQTVGDNLPRLTEALQLALSRADVVVTIGGLGPTEDDLTRDGVAAALGVELVHDPEIEAQLRHAFAARRLQWSDRQLRQAQKPVGASLLPNPNGTAPGLLVATGPKTVIAMPGPSNEFVPMLRDHVLPELARLGGGQLIESKTLKIVGLGESMVQEALGPLMEQPDPSVAPYAKTGEVHLRITTKAGSREEALARIEPVAAQIRSILGSVVYGEGDDTLESVVVGLLREARAALVTAESCTGGWLGQRITSVAGASDVYLGGVVSYSNQLKESLLGVRAETLEQHGAVSSETAIEMAAGAAGQLGADYALSVTGVAGPGGGTSEKPVGLVYIGLHSPSGTRAHKHQFVGLRDAVRLRSTQMALKHLRDALISRGGC